MTEHGHRDDPRIPGKGEYSEAARAERLAWAEALGGTDLSRLGERPVDARALTGNLENYVGTVVVPVGLAGPLRFAGDRVSGWRVAPLATTEGALVASTSRGATALSRAGGVRTRVLGQRLMRVPFFEFHDAATAQAFTRWLPAHRPALEAVIGEVSSHARLVELESVQVGRDVHVSFVYETADAAGQNMTTATTWHALQWMEAPLAAAGIVPRHWQIEAAFSGDKRVSFANLIRGRGTRAVAEVLLPADVVRHVLKVEPDRLVAGHRHMARASVMAGEVGRTANAANIVAALFLSTGQDVACVHESALGFLTVEADGDDVYAAMTLPSLAIGTVGGGTHLPSQQACLELLGCAGDDGVEQLAEIVVGFALGLDLSLTAALTTNQFATAHERLGRNRPVRFLHRDELDEARLLDIANQFAPVDAPRFVAAHPSTATVGNGIISDLGTRVMRRKHVGISTVTLVEADGTTRDAVVKAKAVDEEILTALGALAALLGPDLALSWRLSEAHLGFRGLHTRELGLARLDHPALAALRPETYGTWEDAEREIAVVVMEHLGEGIRLRDRADQDGAWSPDDIAVAMRGIATFHGAFLGRAEELAAEPWFGPVPTPEDHAEAAGMYHDVIDHAAAEYPDWFPAERCARWHALVDGHRASRERAAARPATLVHHDCNTRNAAIRDDGSAPPRLVLWDWELATVDIAGRDVAEFLAFALTPDVDAATVAHHVEVHRAAMADAAGVDIDPSDASADYRDGLHTFATTRLLQYVMANEARDFRFLGRVIETTARLCELAGLTGPVVDVRTPRADTPA